MGSVKAWIEVLLGFFILGACFIFTQPIFDFLFAVGNAMGGNPEQLAGTLDSELRYLPVIISLSLILRGFIDAATSEGGSFWK